MRFRYGIPGAEPKQTRDEAQTNLETACFGLYQITLSVQLRGDFSTSIQEFGKLVLKDAAPTESRIVVSKQTHGTQVSRTSRKCVRARMHEKCKHRILVYPKCSKIFDAWKTWRRFVLHLVQTKVIEKPLPTEFARFLSDTFQCAEEVQQIKYGPLSHSMTQPFTIEELQFCFTKTRLNKCADTQNPSFNADRSCGEV